jgi:uncharacterized protein
LNNLSYISPKARVRPSAIDGKGLFAIRHIAKDEIVAIKGGRIFDRKTLNRVAKTLGPAEIQIGEDMFIGPVTLREREGSMLYTNHSCDPNIGVRGQIVFVAMRDIEPGEELTHDWAMTDDDDNRMACKCGSKRCRGVVTGKDWMKKDLQRLYRGYMSLYLTEKIRRLSRG